MKIVNMKKSPFIILLTILILTSCEFLSQLTQFDLPYETSVTIPLTLATDTPLDIATPAINTGIEDAVAQYNTGLDLIDEVALTSMTLTITDPVDGDLGFLKSIEIFMNAEGLDEVKLAYETAVPDDAGAVLELQVPAQDLQEYIKKDTFTLRFRIVTDETVLDDQVLKMNAVFHVDAKILGL